MKTATRQDDPIRGIARRSIFPGALRAFVEELIRPRRVVLAEGEGGDNKGDDDKGGEGGDDKGGGDDKEFQAITSQEQFDRMIQDRLRREKSKYSDYDDIKRKAEEYDKAADAQKSDLQKANDAKATAEKDAADAKTETMRLRVALRKGLTETQAKRLVGQTEEELEADADELLESFKSDDDKSDDKGGKPPSGRPKERLRGGGDPNDEPEETDPRKLAESVSRV